MNIIIEEIQDELDSYLEVLSDTTLVYYVSPEKAHKKLEDLRKVITNLGNNPNMIGAYICPWEGLGQELNEEGNEPLYPNLMMYDYRYAPKATWHIVYMVDKPNNTVRFTKLFGEQYNTGKRLFFRSGKPIKEIKECLEWMVKLGCFKQYQIETLREREFL